MILRERLALVIKGLMAEGHKQEEIAAELSQYLDGGYRYTRQAVGQWVSMETSPNPHKLDVVYHKAPQGSLAKTITRRLLYAFPPDNNGSQPPEQGAQHAEEPLSLP